MEGLATVGIPGREYLREALTNCSDPLKAIEDFQAENGILLPSLRPMLPLLDLHGIRRLDFHMSVLEELREKLLMQIQALAKQDGKDKEKKLKELLQKSFPVIKVPTLQPAVMCILKNLSHIEDKYLKILVADKDLYQECDIQVKRQIWQDQQALFGDEVSPLLSQYIQEKEELLFNHTDPAIYFFNPSPKQRRQGEVVQKLLHYIGRNIRLYDMVLQFLRTLFMRTKNIHYCTLRSELLMALHDNEIQEITTMDPCHKFTWCLDACIREKNVDIKRSRELQGFLDGIKRGQEKVLGDISMTLCDPYAVNFLANSVLKILNYLINGEGLPRDNQVLILLLRMLSLGLQGWEMVSNQNFKEPKLDPQLVTKFLPALMSLMVDDQVRLLNSKLPQDDRESAITTIEHSGAPPDAYQAYLHENGVASVLAMYYTLYTAKQKDRQGVMRVLGTLVNCQNAQALDDPFLHSLVHGLIPLAEEFSAEDFCTVVFDELFLTSLTNSRVVHHLLRLLWCVFPKMSPLRIDGLMKGLQSCAEQHPPINDLYKALEERMLSWQGGSIPQISESLDSPLLQVPTPI